MFDERVRLLIVGVARSRSQCRPFFLKIANNQRRMRQWLREIVKIAVSLIVEPHGQLRGSKPPKAVASKRL